MGSMASQTTSLAIIYLTVYSDADQRKRQSSTSLAFVRGIHRWPVNSSLKRPVTRKMFLFDDASLAYALLLSLPRRMQHRVKMYCDISGVYSKQHHEP